MSEVDPKIRAIYYIMLVDEIFLSGVHGQRVLWAWDVDAAEEIERTDYDNKTKSRLDIAKSIVSKL